MFDWLWWFLLSPEDPAAGGGEENEDEEENEEKPADKGKGGGGEKPAAKPPEPEKPSFDKDRAALQVKTFKDNPALWDHVKGEMGESEKDRKLRELEDRLNKREALDEIHAIVLEFGLTAEDEQILGDVTPEVARVLAKRLAAKSAPAEQAAGSNAGRSGVVRLPDQRIGKKGGGGKDSVEEALKEFHR